jgi:hypothetical protein
LPVLRGFSRNVKQDSEANAVSGEAPKARCLFSAWLCCKASPNLRVRLRFAPCQAKKILRQTKQVIV